MACAPMTIDLSSGCDLPSGHCTIYCRGDKGGPLRDQNRMVWQGRQITGRVGMRDLDECLPTISFYRQSKATRRILISLSILVHGMSRT